ncbi:MAG: nitroreductase family protein [Candidatus Lokiarchaeota archaeon]|nr:nitroreductase family protein [Candidatus Lokiarchaeota archaeon]
MQENLNLFIDRDLCIKCNTCTQVCPPFVFGIDDEGYPFENYPEVCSICGHCISVCPKSAIQYRKIGFEGAEELIPPFSSYEELSNLVAKRRSIRRFKDKQIPDNDIQKILDNLIFSPTGHNAQELEYTILKDKKLINEISRQIGYRFQIAKLFIPFLPKKIKGNIRRLIEKWKLSLNDHSEDPFLRNPPCLVIVHAKKGEKFLRTADAGIASYNLILTAESLGIGTCWLGFHAIIANIFPKIKRFSRVPRNHRILATIAIGYPKYQYRRKCARNQLKITIYD